MSADGAALCQRRDVYHTKGAAHERVAGHVGGRLGPGVVVTELCFTAFAVVELTPRNRGSRGMRCM